MLLQPVTSAPLASAAMSARPPRSSRGSATARAVHAQPGDSSVRVYPQPDVGHPAVRGDLELVDRVPGHRHPRHQRKPFGRGQLGRVRVTLDPAAFHRDLGRVVAGEERRVHHDAGNDSGQAEPDDGPVVPGRAPPPGLPAVVDLALVTEPAGREARRPGLDQVLLLREQLVAGADHAAAGPPGREVGQPAEVVPHGPFSSAGHGRLPSAPAVVDGTSPTLGGAARGTRPATSRYPGRRPGRRARGRAAPPPRSARRAGRRRGTPRCDCPARTG